MTSSRSRIDAWFVTPFAFACLIGIVVGLFARTHDVLSPTPSDEVARWMRAGFSQADALRLVALREAGTADIPARGPAAEVAEWSSAGYSPREARDIVSRLAVTRGSSPVQAGERAPAAAERSPGADTHLSALYAAFDPSKCGDLNPDSGTNEYAQAFALAGGAWKKISDATNGVAATKRVSILIAVWKALCD